MSIYYSHRHFLSAAVSSREREMGTHVLYPNKQTKSTAHDIYTKSDRSSSAVVSTDAASKGTGTSAGGGVGKSC